MTITLQKLQQQIIEKYDEDNTNFAQETNRTVAKYFSELKASKSKNDPRRLGTQSTFISKLRVALLENVGPLEVTHRDATKFNSMSAKEQLKFQAQALVTGNYEWVHALVIMPRNIVGIKMNPQDVLQLKRDRAKIDTDKLRDDCFDIDGDRLIEKLCGPLTRPAKRHQLAVALLLVTGRRTAELLKTANFYLEKGASTNDYSCMFSGQMKEGLFPGGPYKIPLLAPYFIVKAAFTRLRELYSAEDLSNEDVNESFSRSINNYSSKEVGLTPHELRGAYSMMTYHLIPKGIWDVKKMSLIGWLSKILGHATPAAAAYYQRMKVESLTGPYIAEQENKDMDEIIVEDEPEDDGWEVSGAVEKKRLVGIKELMERHIRITPSSVRDLSGGSMLTIQRLLAKNKDLVAEYNASLE